jgi:hypothetical protein
MWGQEIDQKVPEFGGLLWLGLFWHMNSDQITICCIETVVPSHFFLRSLSDQKFFDPKVIVLWLCYR